MSVPTIFSTCRPRADVRAGTVRDDEFMADLSRVVNGTAPADYLDPTSTWKSTKIDTIDKIIKVARDDH